MGKDCYKIYIDGQWVKKEEAFGPVAPIITVKGADEAVAVANDSEYGLSAGIITRDEAKGLAIANRLQTGMATSMTAP